MTPPPRLSFTPDGRQWAWDSTSLGEFKTCPRKYQLNILLGYVPRAESVHLTFGLRYHEALEEYDRHRARGVTHEPAVRAAVHLALRQTWDEALQRGWQSDDKNKNRLTLLRSIVWYLDQFAEDPAKTLLLANGAPAVELSFRFELPQLSPAGEPYLLCGHLDRLVEFQGQTWVLDRKTTKNTIGPDFFAKYSPDNQMSVYSLAGRIVYATPVVGVIVDAAQIAVGFSRFQRGFAHRTAAQLEEWLGELPEWLTLAEHYASRGIWPQNDKSCDKYGGCPYRGICGKSPSVREEWLRADFTRRWWDPLQVRGDV